MSTQRQNFERVRALCAKGMNAAQIIRATGIRDNSVYRYMAKADRELARDARRAAQDARRADREHWAAQRLATGLRSRRQVKLVTDGRHALDLIAQGFKPRDALELIGGSRARMYRAMNAALALAEPLLT